jgi:hypothetical protein
MLLETRVQNMNEIGFVFEFNAEVSISNLTNFKITSNILYKKFKIKLIQISKKYLRKLNFSFTIEIPVKLYYYSCETGIVEIVKLFIIFFSHLFNEFII